MARSAAVVVRAGVARVRRRAIEVEPRRHESHRLAERGPTTGNTVPSWKPAAKVMTLSYTGGGGGLPPLKEACASFVRQR